MVFELSSKNLHLIKQMLFFGIVGVITLSIDVGVTSFLFYSLHLPAYLSSGVGFMSGFFFNFPMNRHRVFHHSENDRFLLLHQVIMVVGLSLLNLVGTSWIIDVLVTNDIVKIQVAKFIVTAMIAIWNFIIFKKIIFSKQNTGEADN